MLINIRKKSSFRGSKQGHKGGGGGGGESRTALRRGLYQKKAEIGKDGKASAVVV